MIEFSIKTHRISVDVPDWICGRFDAPIIQYLCHKEDKSLLFFTFLIMDFSKKELAYATSFLPENVDKLDNSEQRDDFSPLSPFVSVHSSLSITPGEDFYSFMEGGNYFLYINLKKNLMRAYSSKEIFSVTEGQPAEIGTTFFKENGNFFANAEIRGAENNYLCFFKASMDLSDIREIARRDMGSISRFAPHMTRKHGDLLLNSAFNSTFYVNSQTGEKFSDSKQLGKFVYRDLYENFCHHNHRKFTEENFNRAVRMENRRAFHEDKEFEAFCQKKGTNLMEICRNEKKYSFSILPGKIIALDMKSGDIEDYDTTLPAPAHFEIDPKDEAIYTSSHNFLRWDKFYFLGPAAIDKFLVKDNKLRKIATFIHPTGYRFTSHRIFHYKEKAYLCTIGHPNRLFFIDAHRMELLYWHDLFGDVLSDKIDIAGFLNNINTNHFNFKAIEVSKDGELVYILGRKDIHIFSFPEKKIVVSIPYLAENPTDAGISIRNYYDRTTHINYLR